ncbi:HNH endonuclease signature motif containing protein [Nocardioides lentus]|uniref:HNH endonuclease signature motif containing protein n=1 Tax=Nocardioides lentus TaxID=338077 RepID=A0ABP5ANX3_9ACTN
MDSLIAVLAIADATDTDAGAIDRIRDLERLKAAAAATQARLSAELLDRAEEAHAARRAAGVEDHSRDPHDPHDPHGSRAATRSVAAQIALARRESPHRGRELLTLARLLATDLPHLRRLVEDGQLSEHRAHVIATQLRDLPPAQRREADTRLAGPDADLPPTLSDGLSGAPGVTAMGTAECRDAARRLALRLDPDGCGARRARARTRRRITSRVAPDDMTTLSAFLGDLEAHTVMTSLRAGADAEIAARTARTARTARSRNNPGHVNGHGMVERDTRTREQVIADLFVARLTGQVAADATPVAVQLVVPAEVLLGDDDSPAHVPGLGPLPAPVARRMVHASPEVRTTIRRLYTHAGALVAMDSTARTVTGALRTYIALRDAARCRTPYCDAPIRHIDHITPAAAGGPTTASNTQGLCAACNHTKEAWGWRHHARQDSPLEPHTVQTTTPTGHTHTSRAPDLPTPLNPMPPPTSHHIDLRWDTPIHLDVA